VTRFTPAAVVRQQCGHVSDLCASVSSAATRQERERERESLRRNANELRVMTFRKNADLEEYSRMVLRRAEQLLAASVPESLPGEEVPKVQIIDLFDALKRALTLPEHEPETKSEPLELEVAIIERVAAGLRFSLSRHDDGRNWIASLHYPSGVELTRNVAPSAHGAVAGLSCVLEMGPAEREDQ